MDSVLEYMARKHSTLVNDYRTPNGKYCESCAWIVVEVARKLLSEDKAPSILMIQGEPIQKGIWLGNKTLIPKMYGGRVAWEAHQFCMHGEEVYDPLFEKPTNIKDYVPLVFGEGNFLINMLISPEEVREFVSR